MKKITFLIVLLLVAGVIFSNEYVVVGISYLRRTSEWEFYFTANNLNLTPVDGFLNAFASLCNYMYTNNYLFVHMDRINDDNITVLFKKNE